MIAVESLSSHAGVEQGSLAETPLARLPKHDWTIYGLLAGAIDRALAALLLALTSPLILLGALAVKLTSPGPILYTQTRVGKGGVPFTIFKLRSMRFDCEKQSGACWSTKGDTRITPVGRFLRTSHIDELPQLWNILCGQMSLIGPRPERPEFVGQLARAVPRYRERLLVRPGLTGLAQVVLPPDSDIASVRRKLAHDLYYITNRSWWLDLRLLVGTAFLVVKIPVPLGQYLLALPNPDAVERAYDASLAPVATLRLDTRPAQDPPVTAHVSVPAAKPSSTPSLEII